MNLLQIYLDRETELFLQIVFSMMISVFPGVLSYIWHQNRKMKKILKEKTLAL
jgi:hypothetical protein